MTLDLGMYLVIGVLIASGTFLLIERSITRMLLGLLLIGNGVNLMLIVAGGPPGEPPLVGRFSDAGEGVADPLAQAMVLTAIVISMGIAAFVLTLAYRSYQLNVKDALEDDPEDTRISKRRVADAPDRDRSDDPVTGEPSMRGDAFDEKGNPIPLEKLTNSSREDIEAYATLHDGEFDADEGDADEDDDSSEHSSAGAGGPDAGTDESNGGRR